MAKRIVNTRTENQTPQLSLVAQFDELVRLQEFLIGSLCDSGIEDEFIKFGKTYASVRKKWKKAMQDLEEAKQTISQLRNEKDVLDTKLKHMRVFAESEMQKKLKLEKEKKSLTRQIELIKEVLFSDQNQNHLNDQTKEKLAFLRVESSKPEFRPSHLNTIEETFGSALDSSDLSFDKTEDFDSDDQYAPVFPRRKSAKGKRSSKELLDDSQKKKAKFEEIRPHFVDAQSDSSSGKENADDNLEHSLGVMTRSKQYFSEPTPNTEIAEFPRPTFRSDNDVFVDAELMFTSESEERVTLPTEGVFKSTPVRRISSTGHMNKAHAFCIKTVIKPEVCNACGGRIRFYRQALRCQECRIVCHTDCREKAPLPCYPSVQTPTGKTVHATLADFAPSVPPMIPSLVVHCVREIETRGLEEIGLYRVSGSEREVKDLKEKFLRGKCMPCLSKMDIHAVCGTVKEFLRSLSDSLITKALFRDFLLASEMKSTRSQLIAVQQAVSRMPRANRDTLAFLMLHLHSIATSVKCKMTIENLGKIFGPTVIGYSTSDVKEADILKDTASQWMIMQALFRVPTDYWTSFVVSESKAATLANEPKYATSRPLTSRTASYRTRGVVVDKVPLPPRETDSMKTRRRYLTSPVLKKSN